MLTFIKEVLESFLLLVLVLWLFGVIGEKGSRPIIWSFDGVKHTVILGDVK